jgi:predicted nucleotidyltransferase
MTTLHTPGEIQDLCERIVREFKPDKVVLFGSYAYGVPRPESDVDLLVVMPYSSSSGRAAAEVLNRTRPAFGVDIVVRTSEEVAERVAMGDHFMREIIERGKVLYEANHD